MKNLTYKIKPSASLITTIGSEIIKDPFAAIIELVKNSYDADATNVKISFKSLDDNDGKHRLEISIKDNGLGMSPDTVKNAWLVPATKYKLNDRTSKSGRKYLGRKGIGRYASSILGDSFSMTTIDSSNNKTSVNFRWSDFSKYDYLDEVPIILSETKSDEPSGTSITIIYEFTEKSEWTNNLYDKLILELSLLVSPLKSTLFDNSNSSSLPFNIYLTINDAFNEKLMHESCIEPINIESYYNYRIYGFVYNDGSVDLTYENNCTEVTQSSKVNRQFVLLPKENQCSYCGKVYLDLRVFDRDPSAIKELTDKYNNSEDKSYFSKLKARQLLNEISGVKLYRNNFRIRPYGEKGNDWLNLDKERVQNPSFKIGNNQICGYAIVEDEENSHLIEKSSREGLKENIHYYGLINIIKFALTELEERRYAYRAKSGKGRTPKKVTDVLQNVVDFKQLTVNIDTIIKSDKGLKQKTNEVTKIIENAEIKANKAINDLKEIIARYQGQATLGKIIMIVLHEGRKPIQHLNSQRNRLEEYNNIINSNPNSIDKIMPLIQDDLNQVSLSTKLLTDLFDKIQPLAIKSKTQKKKFDITESIKDSINIYKNILTQNNIKIIFDEKPLKYYGYKEDIVVTFTNLLENSIYWLKTIRQENLEIKINYIIESNNVTIYYHDNGPGIEKENLENQIIFEPNFTTKTDGTGIGLAICGEAIQRNDGDIEAVYFKNGAKFVIKLPLQGGI